MNGLDDAGIRELGLLRHRVRRLYGTGRLNQEGHDTLITKMDELAELFNRYSDKKGRTDAPEKNADDRE